jgi:four helix bundle protein
MKHTDLIVWKKSVDLTVEIYKTTAQFPRIETYGLQSQMRRSAITIPSNISEGEGRASKRETRHFYNIARGSVMELETQTVIAFRLGYLAPDIASSLQARINEVGRILTAMIKKMTMPS